MTFEELLNALRVADESLETEIDFTIVDNLMEKVDAIRFVASKMDAEITGISEEIRKLQARKLRLVHNQTRFEKFVIDTMVSQEAFSLPGNAWSMSVVDNPEKVLINREPEMKDFLDLPDAVSAKIEYSWRKSWIKDHIQDFKEIATIERGKRLKFSRKNV